MKWIVVIFLFGSVLNCDAQKTEVPKLVVGIVVDQMCYEYLYRYQDKFCDKGFRLLMNKGTNCRNTSYNFIPTYTGPGHASIYTGTTPSNHGIVGNDWFDRTKGANVNCVQDSTVVPVGTVSGYGYFSPKHLKANTITDQLKLTYPESKVISMSIKNRGAILPGGHLSDGSYWYDYATGKFITSSFFENELPQWVVSFNNKNFVEESLKKEWNTLLDISSYTESGPDDSPYEHVLPGKTAPTFPYNLAEMTNGMVNYELFVYTPFSNTYLTDLAIASIDNENLGQDTQTDMLCISYSSPDIIGHAFGPYSIEVEDMYIRLDLEIARLIEELNTKVGEREFTLFLTADHAVVPVPQYLTDKGLPGGYFFLDTNLYFLRQSVAQKYGQDLILSMNNMNVYLDHQKIEERSLSREDVSNYVASVIQKWQGVKRVFTGHQLYNAAIDDEWMDMVRKGFHHAESGDVVFILEPGYLPKSMDSDFTRKGTSHGSAYSYDTHVPLIWYGNGIPEKEVFRSISITDISATLTHILNLQNPNALTGEPILEVLNK